MPASVPPVLAQWMQPFTRDFTTAVWRHVLVLVTGTLLLPGRRTVAAVLRVLGLGQTSSFALYHRVLSTARWSSRAVAHHLLRLLVAAFVPRGPVVLGLDDTIERRWGLKIKARGIYRDPVRSSHVRPESEEVTYYNYQLTRKGRKLKCRAGKPERTL
jgi:hypothetical protein